MEDGQEVERGTSYLYSSPNSIRQVKSRRMRWAGRVARIGEECVQGFGGKARKKENWEDQDVDGRMGSEWILGRLAGGVWSGFNWLRIRTVSGLL
jgi:hypothetical protein